MASSKSKVTVREQSVSLAELEAGLRDEKRRKVLLENISLDKLYDAIRTINSESTDKRLVNMLLSCLPSPEDSRSFSKISNEDEQKMNILPALKFVIAPEEFVPRAPSDWFSKVTSVINFRWSLKSETGRRTLIDMYLLEALDAIDDAQAVFPEFNVSATDIGNGLVVSGDLDYVGAPFDPAEFDLLRKSRLRTTHAGMGVKVVVVEAKKDETFGAGAGQLLAQMRALQVRQPGQKIFGVLTDALRWTFYVLHEEGIKYCQSLNTKGNPFTHDDDCMTILGILSYFVRAKLPAGVTMQ